MIKKSVIKVINKCYEIYQESGYAAVIDNINANQKSGSPVYSDIIFEHCTECNNDMPTLNHICLICGQNIIANVQNNSTTNVHVPEFILNLDMNLLKEYKEILSTLIKWNKVPLLNKSLDGILQLIDNIQDCIINQKTEISKAEVKRIIGDIPDGEYTARFNGDNCTPGLKLSDYEVNKFNKNNPEKSIWKEIHSVNAYWSDNEIHINAWLTTDNNELGNTIAKIYPNGNIKYLDERAITDSYAQEIIKNIMLERLSKLVK